MIQYGRGKNPNSIKNSPFKIGHKINIGRICSDTTKRKIGEKNRLKIHKKGWHQPEITRQKIREAQLREKSYNWKGGITPLYKQIFQSFKYRQWRSDIFERDGYICQECNIKKLKICAHHIKSFASIIRDNNIKTLEEALNCEELWNINNGRILCIECHKKTKTYGKRL